jgi:eukaryotic-like serine/threonine-protein kinase
MRRPDSPIKEVAGYQLAECIGSGGMGDVYKAYNSSLNRFAAVKILYHKEFAERFKNEAYIQSSVSHPNIARLYEYAAYEDKPCIVMEYVEGESLDALLRRKGKLSSEETENIIRQVVSALAYLHKKEIMHRDIKPQNFKIQSDGTVKMLDFGIAKHKYSPKLTQVGFVIGTMEYLAPEQFQQKEELKSDVWATGVMAYELVTGYMPFDASNPVTLRSKITKGSFTNPKILIPEISDKLVTVIDKCLRVNTAGRSTSAEIENILGRKKLQTNINQFAFLNPSLKKWLVPGIACFGILFFFAMLMFNNIPDKPEKKPANGDSTVIPDNKTNPNDNTVVPPPPSPDYMSVKITTTNAPNAVLFRADDSAMSTPCTIPCDLRGKDGEVIQFTIRAEGFIDKKGEVTINPRRFAYDCRLDKINN